MEKILINIIGIKDNALLQEAYENDETLTSMTISQANRIVDDPEYNEYDLKDPNKTVIASIVVTEEHVSNSTEGLTDALRDFFNNDADAINDMTAVIKHLDDALHGVVDHVAQGNQRFGILTMFVPGRIVSRIEDECSESPTEKSQIIDILNAGARHILTKRNTLTPDGAVVFNVGYIVKGQSKTPTFYVENDDVIYN